MVSCPAKKKSHDFVVELSVGHADAFIVLGLQQDAEQISGHPAIGAALPDDPVDNLIELPDRTLQSTGWSGWESK